jgi:hypothetical protein
MVASEFGRLVMVALDPVLVAAGFARGQGGGTEVIYCAAHDEFSDRYPWMPQADTQERDLGACVDLIIRGLEDGGFASADLEQFSLPTTLRMVGRGDDADAVERQEGAHAAQALPVLVGVLSRLFVEAT